MRMRGPEKMLLLMTLTVAMAAATQEDSNQKGDRTVFEELDIAGWQKAYDENRKMLLLYYPNEDCSGCRQARANFEIVSGQPEVPEDVSLVVTQDAKLAKRLEVGHFPALVYLREKSWVLYDGHYEVEDILDWMQRASLVATHLLNDDSFEHLTQASTGATTGDWLVAFYTDSCKTILTTLETLGVRIRGHTNVAKVNVADNNILAERFNIQKCPQVILFKKGKMYRYDLPKTDVASLKSFVEGFYRNSKAVVVPGQKSSFDYLTENIADHIKSLLHNDRGFSLRSPLVFPVGIASALLMVFIVLCCCCRTSGKQKDKKLQ